MSVTINTNVDSLKIQGNLTSATSGLAKAMQRMSNGMKISSAKDDAAGSVISSRMLVQLDGNKICQNNIQNANSLMSTAEGYLDVVLDNVTRIRDLTLEVKNGTYSNEEAAAVQQEVKDRLAEIDRVSNSAKFSQLYLFEDAALKEHGITFQVGQNAEQKDGEGKYKSDNIIEGNKKIFDSVKFSALTNITGGFNLADIKKKDNGDNTVTTNYTSLNMALEKLDNAIDNLTERKSLIGSAQSRLESALDTLTTQYTNLSSAKSIITDADIAEEASAYTQNQILQQVATSLLAQANQAPAVALSLI
ncbi:MAG: hypothetical protein IJ877_04275 [Candidatus Gastranaerophilales bacterium]|nr:hypothetical protein [Candidatus Gastranaerophilales bacterium]